MIMNMSPEIIFLYTSPECLEHTGHNLYSYELRLLNSLSHVLNFINYTTTRFPPFSFP